MELKAKSNNAYSYNGFGIQCLVFEDREIAKGNQKNSVHPSTWKNSIDSSSHVIYPGLTKKITIEDKPAAILANVDGYWIGGDSSKWVNGQFFLGSTPFVDASWATWHAYGYFINYRPVTFT